MKMKKCFFLTFLFGLFVQTNAQTVNSCGAEPLDSASFEEQPWFGNNEYLLNLLDSLGYWQGQNLMFEDLHCQIEVLTYSCTNK
ncbi:MAG: hypothetical protein KF882_09755 [Bacteroidia bacterium]|nr:hypothetical protein [Bacteroidia bacterium]